MRATRWQKVLCGALGSIAALVLLYALGNGRESFSKN